MSINSRNLHFYSLVLCVYCALYLSFSFFVPRLTHCYFFDEYILFFIVPLIIAVAFNHTQLVRLKKGCIKETEVGSNSWRIIFFLFFYLIIFSAGFILFQDYEYNEKFATPFLIKLFMLFQVLPLFVDDIRMKKTKKTQCLIIFPIFFFLLPFYLGPWANDIIIISYFMF